LFAETTRLVAAVATLPAEDCDVDEAHAAAASASAAADAERNNGRVLMRVGLEGTATFGARCFS